MDSPRRKIVTVVCDGSNAQRDKAILVGEWIAQSGYHLLTGGGGGAMAAVSDYFVESAGREGLAIGIIPGSSDPHGDRLVYRPKGNAYPNPSVEVAIFTHLPGDDPEGERSRNHINVLSADLVVGLAGGAGTHTEIQLARRYRKPVLLFLTAGDSVFGKSAETLKREGFTIIEEMPDLIAAGMKILEPERETRRPVCISLQKSVLRSYRWTDAEALERHANNRSVSRNLHDGFPSPYTARDARRWLTRALSASPETSFAIEVEGEAVGGIGFVLKDGEYSRAAEMGYWLGEGFWGRGIVSESLQALTDLVFDNYADICRLYAHVFDWNAASMRVLEKAGYVREGVMRKSALKAGRIVDMALYARLRT